MNQNSTARDLIKGENHQRYHFPAAVHGDLSSLSPEARQEVQLLTRKTPVRTMIATLSTWLTITVAIAVSEYVQNPIVTLMAIAIIASRQFVLFFILHEQAHQNFFKQGKADFFVNILTGYPLFLIDIEQYSRVHLRHHAQFFTLEDPDFIRKSGENWNLPLKRSLVLKLILRDLCGLSAWAFFRGKRINQKTEPTQDKYSRKNPTPFSLKVVFYLALITVLTLTQTWGIFLLYWALPVLTVFQVFMRWGALSEHQYNIEGADLAQVTPLLIPNLFERWLIPNLNFGYHVYHHLVQGIPWCHLPKVHQIFVREGLIEEKNIFRSHLQLFRAMTTERSKIIS